MVEAQPCRGSRDASFVKYGAARRCKVLGARIADIVFRRLQAVPIGGNLRATGIDRNQLTIDTAGPGLCQQLLNNPFRLFVFALAEFMMSNTPLRIDEIEGWPILVLKSAP